MGGVMRDEITIPPHNIEAEQSVLGAILLDNSTLSHASDLLSESDFYLTKHRLIFHAMVDLAERNEPIDNLTLHEYLTQCLQLQEAGGASYLAELVAVVPTATNTGAHARIVRDAAKRRQVIQQAEALKTAAYDGASIERLEADAAKLVRSNGDNRPEPIDPSWPVMDEVALYGLTGEIVRLLSPHTEADLVALLVSFLSEFGAMVGRKPHLLLDGSFHPLLVWPVFIGRSSKSRKGTTDKRIGALLRAVDSSWTRGECRGNLSSGEGLAFAVRDSQYREEPIREKGRPTGEIQTVCIDSGIEDKRLFLVQAEFGAVLRVMAREGNSLSGVLRDAWDGLDLAPMTKGNRIRASTPHIGIAGHVTQDELLRNLSDTEASNGFGNRFIWLVVRRSKELPFGSEPDPGDLRTATTKIARALEKARALGRLTFSHEAAEIWRAIYSDLSAERPGLVGALLGRAEAQVMRLSALYAALDGNPSIERTHLEAALAIWQYAEASASMIFGDATGDSVADTILRAVRQSGELTDTQISHLFGRHVSASRLAQAKTTLQAKGRLKPFDVATNGRSAKVWRIAN